MKTRHAKTIVAAGAALALTALLAGCNPPSTASTDELPDNHDDLVALAQQEGVVRIGTGGHTEGQVAQLAEAFEAEYGIRVEFVRESSGQIVQKVEAQATSGNIAFDVVSVLDSETMQRWTEEAMLLDVPLENGDDILPAFATGSDAYHPIFWQVLGYTYNEERTPNPPTTWEGLAGDDVAIGLGNPASSGSSLTFATVMADNHPDFYASVAASSHVLVQDSALGLGQLVLTGEVDFAVPGSEQDVFTQAAAGEPIRMGYPEGPIGATVSYVGGLSGAQSPAAAQLLVQFMLSEAFQETQLTTGSRPVLSDVASPEGLEEIAEDRIVTIDTATLAAKRDEIVAAFDQAVSA